MCLDTAGWLMERSRAAAPREGRERAQLRLPLHTLGLYIHAFVCMEVLPAAALMCSGEPGTAGLTRFGRKTLWRTR